MIRKYKKYIYVILSIIVVILLVVTNIPKEKEDSKIEEFIPTNEINDIDEYYYIDIKGEVNKPGVYKIDSDSRIIDAISLAGGLTEDADTSLLNLSKKVIDEANIKIYSKKEVKEAIDSIKSEPEVIEVIKYLEKECVCPTTNDACINEHETNDIVNNTNDDNISDNTTLININTASKDDLMNIPGIKDSKAESIIEYRKTTKFNIIDDIKNISGIGDATFEKIKKYITV